MEGGRVRDRDRNKNRQSRNIKRKREGERGREKGHSVVTSRKQTLLETGAEPLLNIFLVFTL